MPRFIIDPSVVFHLADRNTVIPSGVQLVAPTLIRSQVLSFTHESVMAGDIEESEAKERLDYFGRLKIRLLGDAVLRRTAWKVADRLAWAETYRAEYIALTQLQGDALITLDAELATAAKQFVKVVSIDVLR